MKHVEYSNIESREFYKEWQVPCSPVAEFLVDVAFYFQGALRRRQIAERKLLAAPSPLTDFQLEQKWIQQNAAEFAGKWVALKGYNLIASGERAKEVYDQARAFGYSSPRIAFIEPAEELSFAGW